MVQCSQANIWLLAVTVMTEEAAGDVAMAAVAVVVAVTTGESRTLLLIV